MTSRHSHRTALVYKARLLPLATKLCHSPILLAVLFLRPHKNGKLPTNSSLASTGVTSSSYENSLSALSTEVRDNTQRTPPPSPIHAKRSRDHQLSARSSYGKYTPKGVLTKLTREDLEDVTWCEGGIRPSRQLPFRKTRTRGCCQAHLSLK